MRLIFALLLLLGVACNIPGAEPKPATVIAPFVNEETVAVIRVDIAKSEHLRTKLVKGFSVTTDQPEQIQKAFSSKEIDQAIDSLKAAGANEFYVVLSPADLGQPLVKIFPGANAADAKKIAEIFDQLFSDTKHTSMTINNCLCLGSETSLAISKERQAKARPDIVASLEMGQDSVAQIAFAFNPEMIRVFKEISPKLPEELGGGAIEKLVEGVQSVSADIGPGEKMPARLVIQAKDKAALTELLAIRNKAFQWLQKELMRADPEYNAFTQALVSGHAELIVEERNDSQAVAKWNLADSAEMMIKNAEKVPVDYLRTMNNLKQIGLAYHNFHDATGKPVDNIRDKDGKALLSWRVAILPYIDQAQLYQKFKLDEPWDSEHNKKLIPLIPKMYQVPLKLQKKDSPYLTNLLAPVAKGTAWEDPLKIRFPNSFNDGTSNTVLFIEANVEDAVIWSKPEDATIDPKAPSKKMAKHHAKGYMVAFADGSVYALSKQHSEETLWAFLTISGGEVTPGPETRGEIPKSETPKEALKK